MGALWWTDRDGCPAEWQTQTPTALGVSALARTLFAIDQLGAEEARRADLAAEQAQREAP